MYSSVTCILLMYYTLFLKTSFCLTPEERANETVARAYIEDLNRRTAILDNRIAKAGWAYSSNLTEENLKLMVNASIEYARKVKENWQETILFPWRSYQDQNLKRQFKKYSVLDYEILPSEKLRNLTNIVAEMQGIYSKAKVCSYENETNCDLSLEPELTDIFATSQDPEELKHLWTAWRNESGRKVRRLFESYVGLVNEAANLNNFTDISELWLVDYEAEDFKDQIRHLWEQIKPLYLQLHAYVRRRLREFYGAEVVSERGPIPAHLLGNVWAQSWGNIVQFTIPHPEKAIPDVTEEMINQNYTVHGIFKLAEEFFTSLNLSAMTDIFWQRSIIEKPTDREIICHASAWDFYDGDDFRIKQCTTVGANFLYTTHHEMGHIEYYLQYENQPHVYKRGANPGFHEAIGDVITLSVLTQKHLRKIGLLNTTGDDPEVSLNALFMMGLNKLAVLPFTYLLDLWRWDVFKGRTTPDDYNCKWWELREEYQGLEPPVNRSEEDFDPGAKYHVVATVPYIRYFVSHVIQFQIHRKLCEVAGEYDRNDSTKPLHECDIYQNHQAGELFKKILQSGSSKPWQDLCEETIGQRTMDASALLEYFKPLHDWLKEENQKTNQFIGWEHTSQKCLKSL